MGTVGVDWTVVHFDLVSRACLKRQPKELTLPSIAGQNQLSLRLPVADVFDVDGSERGNINVLQKRCG